MKLPALPVSDHLSTLNFEAIVKALSTAPYATAGGGGTTTSTGFVTGPAVTLAAGNYRIDFGGFVQIQTAALEQGNLRVHLAGSAVGVTAAFVGRNQYDGASIASSFDLSTTSGGTLDLRYSTNNGTSVAFSSLWLRATLIPS